MTHSNVPSSVLFVCYLNSIRSPIAEGLTKKNYPQIRRVESCGIAYGDLDELMVSVMRDVGVDMSGHKAQSLADFQDQTFDRIIAFTAEAEAAAKAVFADQDIIVEFWPIPEPTHGSLDVRALLNNYRSVRDTILQRLHRHFG